MPRTFFAIEVVRQVEATVEIIVEAADEDTAQAAALAHLKARGDEYEWLNPKSEFIVWRKRPVDTPPIVDVTA